jgi:colanic acid/amylovoran biosynthesis protein
MNFLITNMTGFRNKGCEATTKAIVNEIAQLQDSAKFKIFTEDVDYNAFWIPKYKNVSFLISPFRRQYFFRGLSFLPRWWQYRLIGKSRVSLLIRKAVETFHQADAVLSSGGDVFSSTYGNLARHLAPLRVAASFGKPIILVGHSIGPFENQSEYKAFVKTMKYVQLITVRDSLSLEYLKNMKLKSARIELTVDPAFCLEPDMEKVEKSFKIYNIPREKILIGVAPSQGIAYYSRTSYQSHFNTLGKLIGFLTEKLGCHVILIPHVHESSVTNDDRVICELLHRKLGFPKNVTMISLTHSAEEIRAIVSTLDLMIAERMHAAIASLSQNVPTFVVGYSVKVEGILGDIFGFDSLEDYMISVKKMDEEKLKECVKKLLNRRSEVAKHLSNVIPRIKENAIRNFTLIMEVLEKRNT